MKKASKTIVFFGSGPVAAKSLQLLVRNFNIEAVVTKPRALHHHGDVPVLKLAEELHLKVLTATDKQSLDRLFVQKPVTSDLGILVDFGIIVSKTVIDYFPLGIINSHFSLLPEWRGADPITFSILSGQTTTGVSLMLLAERMDEGPLLAQVTYNIMPKVTASELTHDLTILSYQLLTKIVPRYLDGKIQPYTQGKTKIPTYSRKLTKEDGIIDWHKPAKIIECEIRAFIEWPKSRAKLGNLSVILTAAHVVRYSGKPGTVSVVDKTLIVYCGDQALAVDKLKPAGKPEMTALAFLSGYSNLLIKN